MKALLQVEYENEAHVSVVTVVGAVVVEATKLDAGQLKSYTNAHIFAQQAQSVVPSVALH